LVFPVTWEEPFGLAVTESLFMGTPVFATPYGSLSELISTPDFGSLSNIEDELADAIQHGDYNPTLCHEYARDTFDHISMAKAYIEKYEKVLNGEALNKFLSKPAKQVKKLPYFR
ncbi:glycosyltransferase family 4 protein, partial [Vibrio owensii]